jgi:undecaprenyl-diphosphatase
MGDLHDYEVVNRFARSTEWLHGAATAYADDGVLLFAALLLVAVWRSRRAPSRLPMARALLAGAGVLIAVAANQPLVHAFGEPRPWTRLPSALVLVHRSVDASFPSDHATMAGAVAAGLLLAHRTLGLLAAFLAVVMAADRVYVGAHYPIDVLAGLAFGATVALVVQLAAPLLASWLERRTHGPARPLLVARS